MMLLHNFLPRNIVDDNNFRFYHLNNVQLDPARHIIYNADEYEPSLAIRIHGLSPLKYNKTRKFNLALPESDLVFEQIDDALCIPTNKNFYHMMVDCLPRLWGTFESNVDRVLICDNMLDKLPHIFPAIKDWIPIKEWIFTQVDEHKDSKGYTTRQNNWRIKGNNLSFYSSSSPDTNMVFHHNKYLAAAFWRKWYNDHYSDQLKTRRVFLARTVKDNASERCVNQQEIFESLPGFEWIDPHEHDFISIAHIMNSAEIVIGAHGAGLANLLFCQPGIRFIQLNNSSGSDHIFRLIAAMMNLRYSLVIGYDPQTGLPCFRNKHESWRVDPNDVLAQL